MTAIPGETEGTGRKPLHEDLWFAAVFYIVLAAGLVLRLSPAASPTSPGGEPSARLLVAKTGALLPWLLFAAGFTWRLICRFLPDKSGMSAWRSFRPLGIAWPAGALLGLLKITGVWELFLEAPPGIPDVFILGTKTYTVLVNFSVLLWFLPVLLVLQGLASSPLPERDRTKAFRAVGFKFLLLFFSAAWLTQWLMWPEITTWTRRLSIYLIHDRRLLYGWLPLMAAVYALFRYSRAGLTPWRARLALGLRWLLVTLLMAAFAGPRKEKMQEAVTVVYVLDVSRSIPEEMQRRAVDVITETVRRRAADDQAALVLFAGRSQTELPRDYSFEIPDRFATDFDVLNVNATDIRSALDNASALFPKGGRKKIVLLTDGNPTTAAKSCAEKVTELGARGIAVNVVTLEAGVTREVMLDKLQLGADVLHPDEAFDVDAVVRTYSDCVVDVTLFLNGEAIRRKTGIKLKSPDPGEPSLHRVTFRNIRAPGTESMLNFEAVVEVRDKSADTLGDNNSGYAAALVGKKLDILVMTDAEETAAPLVHALRARGKSVEVRTSGNLPPPLDLLHRYDCIVLDGIDSYDLGPERDVNIEAAVKEYGVGLVMIGGLNSFGAGGYIGSAVERALPVTCDVKDSEVLSNGALVVILHTCEFMQGNQWAKVITRTALEQLTPGDYFGVSYYDFSAGEKWLFKPMLCTDANFTFMKNKIALVEPGDMPDYNPTLEMAAAELEKLGGKASVCHLIIISDGDANSPTSRTIQRLRNIPCTVTSVAIQPHGGQEIGTMRRIAKQTGGKYILVNNPNNLPRIFAREARVVRRSLIYENPQGIPVMLHPGQDNGLLAGISELPPLYGLVITTKRQGPLVRNMATTVVGGIEVPVLAWRRYGSGQSVAFTGDATNRWAKGWVAGWPPFPAFWAQVITKVKRKTVKTNFSMEVHPIPDSDEVNVSVDIIDQPSEGELTFTVKGTVRTPAGTMEKIHLEEKDGRYTARLKADKIGSYIAGVQVSDSLGRMTMPVFRTFSYNGSAEFKRLSPNRPLLRKMAEKSISPRKKPWSLDEAAARADFFSRNIKTEESAIDLFAWFASFALLLAVIDIFFRRVFIDVDRAAGLLALWLLKLVPGASIARGRLRVRLDTGKLAMDKAREKVATGVPDTVRTGKRVLHEALAEVDAERFEQERPGSDAPEPGDVRPTGREAKPTASASDGDRPESEIPAVREDSLGRLLKAKRRLRGGKDGSDETG